MRLILSFVLMFMLAGCAAKALPVTSISEIKPLTGARGIDVYALRRAKGEKVPDYAGEQLLEIRTYEADENNFNGRGKEIAGADCQIRTGTYSARVTTPAKLRVPIYRRQSPPISAKCSKAGYKPNTAVATVYNKTKRDRMAGASGAGALGVLTIALVNAASNEATHEFRYYPLLVTLQPIASTKSRKTARAAQ